MTVVMTNEKVRTVKNADAFTDAFTKASDAAIGVIVIRTREMERCKNILQDISVRAEAVFKLWTCYKGWMTFPTIRPDQNRDVVDISKPVSNDAQTIDIGKAMAALLEEASETSIHVMYHPHHHYEKPLIQQYLMDVLHRTRERSQRLVMIVPDTVKIPSEIEDYLHIMDFLPPSHAELRHIYDELLSSVTEGARPKFDDDEIDTIIQNGVGMTAMEFETALSVGLVENEQPPAQGSTKKASAPEDYIQTILTHKTEVVKKTDLLELMPSETMENVGGFDKLKQWLQMRAAAYDEAARQYGIKAPRGMLCVGPPGSGKSLLAKAVASEFSVPLVKFDIGKVFGKFVGESEGRIRSAIKIIESMAPCVLLVDEIDKGFGGLGGGGTDGGTSMRVLGSFLNWMQDRDNEKSPVFVCMTANNVVGLPPELMRRGRIDEIFACTFPSHDERIEILGIHLKKRGHKLPKSELARVAAATDHYVGSELEGIVENALLQAYTDGLEHPTADLMINEASAMVPLYTAFADKVNFMNEWAKKNAKPASSGMKFDIEAPVGSPKGGLRRNVKLSATTKTGNKLDG